MDVCSKACQKGKLGRERPIKPNAEAEHVQKAEMGTETGKRTPSLNAQSVSILHRRLSSAQDSPTSRSQKKRTGKEKSKKMKLIVNLKKQSRKDGTYPLKVIDLLCRRYHISSPNSSVWSDALPAGSFSSSSYPTVVSFACTSTCPSPSPCTPWPCI